MSNRLTVRIDSNPEQKPEDNVKVTFGPHYFVDIMKDNGGIKFVLGATHHGVMLDASDIEGELEQVIWKLRNDNPEATVD